VRLVAAGLRRGEGASRAMDASVSQRRARAAPDSRRSAIRVRIGTPPNGNARASTGTSRPGGCCQPPRQRSTAVAQRRWFCPDSPERLRERAACQRRGPAASVGPEDRRCESAGDERPPDPAWPGDRHARSRRPCYPDLADGKLWDATLESLTRHSSVHDRGRLRARAARSAAVGLGSADARLQDHGFAHHALRLLDERSRIADDGRGTRSGAPVPRERQESRRHRDPALKGPGRFPGLPRPASSREQSMEPPP